MIGTLSISACASLARRATPQLNALAHARATPPDRSCSFIAVERGDLRRRVVDCFRRAVGERLAEEVALVFRLRAFSEDSTRRMSWDMSRRTCWWNQCNCTNL